MMWEREGCWWEKDWDRPRLAWCRSSRSRKAGLDGLFLPEREDTRRWTPEPRLHNNVISKFAQRLSALFSSFSIEINKLCLCSALVCGRLSSPEEVNRFMTSSAWRHDDVMMTCVHWIITSAALLQQHEHMNMMLIHNKSDFMFRCVLKVFVLTALIHHIILIYIILCVLEMLLLTWQRPGVRRRVGHGGRELELQLHVLTQLWRKGGGGFVDGLWSHRPLWDNDSYSLSTHCNEFMSQVFFISWLMVHLESNRP